MQIQVSNTETEFGPEKYGHELVVNPSAEDIFLALPVAVTVDIETDEKDHFVGAAVTGGNEVFYVTDIERLKIATEKKLLTGHNLKGDMKWMKNWGVSLDENALSFDTMIASYVANPGREKHGLKPLAKDILGWEWTSYRDMVGKGRGKTTLDKQPVEHVARYCGMDCLATHRLKEYFIRTFTPAQRRVFNNIEMPINKLLYRMEEVGVKINTGLLNHLDVEFSGKLKDLLGGIATIATPEIEKLLVAVSADNLKEQWEKTAYEKFKEAKFFKPSSWQQKRMLLKFLGIETESTDKKELIKFKDRHPLIPILLKYSEINKIYTAFIKSFKEVKTLPTIHTTFNQVSENNDDEDDAHGIKTGRFSSKNPNLQQIPSRTEEGKKLRNLFIPREGKILACFDYSQVELRLMAHYSHDPVLLDGFLNGNDLHEGTMNYVNAKHGLDLTRYDAKTSNFAIGYRCKPYTLAQRMNAPVWKCEKIIDAWWERHKGLWAWEQNYIETARMRGGISTLLGRWRPIADLKDLTCYTDRGTGKKRYWKKDRAERKVINYTIQGSGADILKLAMLQCEEAGYMPILTVHDELVFELNPETKEKAMQRIKEIMESVVTLDVPLVVEGGTGMSWGEAKE